MKENVRDAKQNKVSKNILKVRDLREPISFTGEDGEFQDSSGNVSSKIFGETFGFLELRQQIEPWLTSLFQSEHLNLLAGAGLTHAVHMAVVGDPATTMELVDLFVKNQKRKAAATVGAEKADRGEANFEDQLRAAIELHRGLQILGRVDEAERLLEELCLHMGQFAKSILENERNIADGE